MNEAREKGEARSAEKESWRDGGKEGMSSGRNG